MGALSFWYVWATGIRKKLINLTFKKRKIFRGGSDWPIFSFIFLGVANFKFNFLSHFLINFKNSCAYLGSNFMNFLKHLQLFKFLCVWTKLCKKQGESSFQKIGQLQPSPKIFIFERQRYRKLDDGLDDKKYFRCTLKLYLCYWSFLYRVFFLIQSGGCKSGTGCLYKLSGINLVWVP